MIQIGTPFAKRIRFFGYLRRQSWAYGWIGNEFVWIFPTLRDPKAVDPLPFLIGLKENLAKNRFRFERLEDPDPKRFLLRATPLTPDLKSWYNDILITLESERFLPISLVYRRGRRGKETRQYTFHEITLNSSTADAAFEPQEPRGWEIKRTV